MTKIRVLLAGLGNVGRGVLSIVRSQRELLADRYDLEVLVVAAADSSGALLDQAGLDIEAVLGAKIAGKKVAELPGGIAGLGGRHLVERARADVLLEATPVNLQHAQPGLDTTRAALDHGMACVLANKGPLALGYAELAAVSDLSDPERPKLRFSACVGGALPTINLGRRDLAGARILGVEAMLNGTSQGILRAMERGGGFEDAVREMQRRGIAETDPSLDVDGWDQAVKLVILANAVLGRPTTLADVTVRGIREVTPAALVAARDRGERIVHLGRARRTADGSDWILEAGPESLPVDHPLARMGAEEMGVIYQTDISGCLHATSRESDAVPTAAAMLRDLIEVAR